MNIEKYDLVIFDCDGTLVDSEYMHNKLVSDILIDLGLSEYSPEKCIHDFGGSGWGYIKSEIQNRYQVQIPDHLILERIKNIFNTMENHISPINGALGFVKFADTHCKIAVGSNGEDEIILKSLELLGFMDYFEPQNVFSKNHVPNAKPAPDLFLYAAKQMGVELSRCLVIEDSVFGAQAGLNAGMDVFGFTGVAHDIRTAESKLKSIGITEVFDNFIHMEEHLKA